MANGLVVADTSISVGGRAVLGANLARVQVGMITHTSDTALATQAAGGSQMGAAVSMVVPAAGGIRVTQLAIEYDETEGNTGVFGGALKVGSDGLLWASGDRATGALIYSFAGQANSSVAGVLQPNGFNSANGNAYFWETAWSFDIVGLSISTGTQDIEVWLGDNITDAGEITITGTTTTARYMVEIIDGT